MGIADLAISTDAIIGIIFSILLICFLIGNSIYWYQIMSEFNSKQLVESALTISKGTAQALLIVSIVGVIIMALYMLYNAGRWFYNVNLDTQKNYFREKWKAWNKKEQSIYNDKQSSNKADYSPPASPNSPLGTYAASSSTTIVTPISVSPVGASPATIATQIGSPQYMKYLSPAKAEPVNPEPLETYMGIPFQQPNPNVVRVNEGPISLNKKYTPKYDHKHGALVCGEKDLNEPTQKVSKIIKSTNEYILTGSVPLKDNLAKNVTFDIRVDQPPDSFDSNQPTGTKDGQPIIIDA